ncbi:MAG: cupin domain-containing protein [Cyanobacteria bacterium P01_A01_bin.84]
MKDNEVNSKEIEFSELAALHALDITDEEERNQAENYLANIPEFATQLAEFQEAVAAIPYSATSAPISDNLKRRLFSTITKNILEVESEITKLLFLSINELKQRADGLEWEKMPSCNARMATLQIDEEKRQKACFIRADAKTKFPMHLHPQGEEILLLEGDLTADGQLYRKGDRLHANSGSCHQPETTNGCLVLCISSMDNQLIDPQ